MIKKKSYALIKTSFPLMQCIYFIDSRLSKGLNFLSELASLSLQSSLFQKFAPL